MFLMRKWKVLLVIGLFWWWWNYKLPVETLLKSNYGSKLPMNRYAFVTLCVGNEYVLPSLVLMKSVKMHHKDFPVDYVVMTRNVSLKELDKFHRYKIRTVQVEPIEFQSYFTMNFKKPLEVIEKQYKRDTILFTKLRTWQLVEYEKVVFLDTDLLVVKPIHDLFKYEELAGTSAAFVGEKIVFYNNAQLSLVPRNQMNRTQLELGKTGLNSGVTVIKPSNQTFTSLLNELSILPNRVCCPSQEFLYYYFSERNKFYRIPQSYNVLVQNGTIDHEAKVFHFVKGKPWKKKNKKIQYRMWYEVYEQVLKEIQ